MPAATCANTRHAAEHADDRATQLPSATRIALRELASYVRVERDAEALSVVRARLDGMIGVLDEALEAARRGDQQQPVMILFELVGGEIRCLTPRGVLDLRHRHVVRAFLQVLSRARLESPNKPVRWSRIAAAAWPDQQLLATVARNRIKVGIAWLRRVGLREVIASDARGYWLTDACSVFVSPDPEASS